MWEMLSGGTSRQQEQHHETAKDIFRDLANCYGIGISGENS